MRFQREYIKSNPRSDTAVGLFRIPPKMYFLVIHHLFNRLSKELLKMIVFHGLRLFKNDTAWADRCFSICCWYISELCDNSFMLQKLYQWKKLHSYDHIWELPSWLPKTIKWLFLRKDSDPERNLKIKIVHWFLFSQSYVVTDTVKVANFIDQERLSTIDLCWNVLFHIDTRLSLFKLL